MTSLSAAAMGRLIIYPIRELDDVVESIRPLLFRDVERYLVTKIAT